jgi:hypothetical protein
MDHTACDEETCVWQWVEVRRADNSGAYLVPPNIAGQILPMLLKEDGPDSWVIEGIR